MEKIGISTDIGQNYGSLLQAFATIKILKKIGFEGIVFKPGGSIIKGKDIRFAKLAVTIWRMLLNSKDIARSLMMYTDSYAKAFDEETNCALALFLQREIEPKEYTLRQLKKKARTNEYSAFICGSDQIWITDSFYIDPFYYLTYAPAYKRIAWAPSFGREFVPDYNREKIKRNLDAINHLSAREQSGVEIIKELTGKTAELIIDPTLLLSKEEWALYETNKIVISSYLLAYFLDIPSDEVISKMKEYASANSYKIVGIPYTFASKYADIVPTGIGPYEFIALIKNANIVFTDSFHGTAFSLNFNVPFYTFDRNYGKAQNQSTRITSLLKLTGTDLRFRVSDSLNREEIDFDYVNSRLEEERCKGISYLKNSIEEVKSHEGR